VRRFDQWRELPEEEPVMHVNCHEAEAWCRWAGRRLPSEAEWNMRPAPGRPEGSDRYPWGNASPPPARLAWTTCFRAGSGTGIGSNRLAGRIAANDRHVWEWTSSPFAPYPGFSPDPYKEYSEPWFHSHQVIRGGSFCTRSRLVHNRFRNFYAPERSDMFVGFRSCATR